MSDYDTLRTEFDWRRVQAELAGPGGSINIGVLAADAQVAAGFGERAALRRLSADGRHDDISFSRLADLSGRCAGLLAALGAERGDTVAVTLDAVPELFVAALGIWKAGGIFCPISGQLGPEPLRARLGLSGARILICGAGVYRSRIAAIRGLLPDLAHVLLVGDNAGETEFECRDFGKALAQSETRSPVGDAQDLAMLHFTSGTSGMPKGAVHAHEAVVGHYATARRVLDLRPGDVFWCNADSGWITSTCYGIIAPLICGATCIISDAPTEPRGTYALLRDQAVDVWYTTPGAIRTLMAGGAALARTFRPFRLRVAASVGEPLNQDAVLWGRDVLGVPFQDTWWQTETGCISIANFPPLAIKPGSMGRPVPGIEAAVVGADGGASEPVGELVLKAPWPSMFRGYSGDPDRYGACFADGWYRTGDLVRRDAEGYYWFLGRTDDVIKSLGHLIGPFEVESTLMEHPAVSEAAVVGHPDPGAYEVVKAFVSLNPGFEAGDALRRELLTFARKQLGALLAPKAVEFLDELPKTRSGKIVRRSLKARELGLPDDS